jgi:hypothetical protein
MRRMEIRQSPLKPAISVDSHHQKFIESPKINPTEGETIMPNNVAPQDIKDELAKHAARLKECLDSKKPSVYAPVVWAYQDVRVRDAIATRLAAGEVLIASSQIVPDRALRRERVYYDFAPQGRMDTRNPGILVQLSDDNSVAEIVDPFDPHSAADISAATATDTLPLFAARTSASSQVIADPAAAAQTAARWALFVEQPALARSFGPGGIFGGIFGGVFGGNLGEVVITGGTPTQSSVISGVGSKEDPDQDTQGGHLDDGPA